MPRESDFPLGASLTLDQLDVDPHPALARLRDGEPVSWVPSLGGWLVTRHDLAVSVLGDPGRFTVDDPRFSTGQVIGPSMLTLDGPEHALHRRPFVGAFLAPAVAHDLAPMVSRRARELVEALAQDGRMELRRQFAGPFAAAVVGELLGLEQTAVQDLLRWYDAIAASVTSITAGLGPTRGGAEAHAELRARLVAVIGTEDGRSVLSRGGAQSSGLDPDQLAANGAVLLFGGIETTEAMIANVVREILQRPRVGQQAEQDPQVLGGVIDESLRLEPAAAMLDRYATRDCQLGGATVGQGELVRLSITAANRDPAVFPSPDSFDPRRPNLRRHLAFAQGPHVCLGVHLARLEARTALDILLRRLSRLRLDPDRPAHVRGLVFRKPPRLDVIWDA